jgi:hypothetical protein
VIYGSRGFLLSTSKNNTPPGEDRQQYKNNDRYLNDLISLFLLFGPRPPVGGRGILPSSTLTVLDKDPLNLLRALLNVTFYSLLISSYLRLF